MQLFDAQKKATEELVYEYLKGTSKVDFKAPTGAGKTFIAANVISEILLHKKDNEKLIFVIATLSSAELPKQFAIKLEEYQKYLPVKFNVKRIESPSNSEAHKRLKDYQPQIPLEENQVLIFGKSSFGKNKLLSDMGAFDIFIDQIKKDNYKLIYIRDEAHIGANENTLKNNSEEAMLHNNATFTVRMTATPKSNNKQVIIRDKELENNEKSLLKLKDIFNKNIKSKDKQNIDDFDLLDIALEEFKKIKKEYGGSGINPAALIQVSSKNLNLNDEEFQELIKKYQEIINKKHGLQWATYFSGTNGKDSSISEEVSLANIARTTSPIDVIIFKVGPATGWDIPRACMLIQLRKVYSETLSAQTVGRIRRNPIPGLFKKDFANNYYIYSNYQERSREMFMYELKEKFYSFNVPTIVVSEEKSLENKSLENYHQKLMDWLIKNKAEFTKKYVDLFLKAPTRIPFKLNRYVDNTSKEVQLIGHYWINNSLELQIQIERFLFDYPKIWNLSKDVVESFFENTIKKHLKEIYHSQLVYILISFFWDSFTRNYYNHYANKIEYNYRIKKENYLRKNYIIWANKGKPEESNLKIVNFESVKNQYAYLNSDRQKTYEQALDSNPETIFMTSVIQYMKKNQNINFDLWAKNPSFGNQVFLEYKNAQGSKSKAFIDFIFAKNNKYFYVEIKGHNDYDEEKSKLIMEAFNDYKKINDDFINNMQFALVVVNTEEAKHANPNNLINLKMKFNTTMDNIEFNNKTTIANFLEIIYKLV